MPDRRGGAAGNRRYPRTARVNQVLREILAEALEEESDRDDRLLLVTVTGVVCEPDFRRATVYYSARTEGADVALTEKRVHLQAEIARQTRLKRTPQLSFVVDPGVISGWRIEDVLRGLEPLDDAGE